MKVQMIIDKDMMCILGEEERRNRDTGAEKQVSKDLRERYL